MNYKEKAKRYDEALKAAIVASKDEDRRLKATLERIFPELKEGEDERTWIINYLSNRILNSTIIAEKENLKKAIDWLEKQGEQKPTEFDDTNAKRMFIKALERVEEQNNKGYKLTDCDKNSWWEDFKVYTSCVVEPKQEWSEEDEKMTKNLTSELYNLEARKLIDKETKDKYTKWLKSLKNRCTWKPSEEQMKALKEAVDEHFDIDGGALWHLYEDLKKLMEE